MEGNGLYEQVNLGTNFLSSSWRELPWQRGFMAFSSSQSSCFLSDTRKSGKVSFLDLLILICLQLKNNHCDRVEYFRAAYSFFFF